MNIPVKTSNGIYCMETKTKLFGDRVLFVGEITRESASQFLNDMMALNLMDSSSPIHVMIDSYGGSVNAGMTMIHVIQTSKAPVSVYCTGSAFSMASLILASGKHGRYMLPCSEVMVHEPSLDAQISGGTEKLSQLTSRLSKDREKVIEMYCTFTGLSSRRVKAAISYDHYMGPEEAMKLKLVDGILDFNEIIERIG